MTDVDAYAGVESTAAEHLASRRMELCADETGQVASRKIRHRDDSAGEYDDERNNEFEDLNVVFFLNTYLFFRSFV